MALERTKHTCVTCGEPFVSVVMANRAKKGDKPLYCDAHRRKNSPWGKKFKIPTSRKSGDAGGTSPAQPQSPSKRLPR